MNCPKCGSGTYVIGVFDDSTGRECRGCHHQFRSRKPLEGGFA